MAGANRAFNEMPEEGAADAGDQTCTICVQTPSSGECAFCAKTCCSSCMSPCDGCNERFCSFCSIRNYDHKYDAVFCLSCNLQGQSIRPADPVR